MITDITERRRVEERLRLHSLVLDQIEDRVTVTDLDGYITYINDAACRTLGKDGTRLVGQHVSAFGEDAGKGATQQEIIRRTLQEGAWRGEVTNIRSDGSAVMLDCRSQVVKDDEGRAIALCGISTDVTERKKAEEALRESEHRFRELFNNINDLIYTQDLGGRFLSVNRAMCSSLGYGEDELIGKRASEFMKPEFAGLFEQEYLDRLKTSGYHNGTAVYFTKSGEKIYLEYRSSLVRPEKGEPYISGMGRDVTDKILSEKKIDSLRKQYYHAQRMEAIGTLAGGIAHDFNNILGIILGNTELAMLGLPEWNPARENLEEVCRATLRARDLVTQILLFARQKEHVLSTLLVEPIVKESLKMLRASIPTTVEMRQEIREGLPPILADPSQIQQIVMNLCTNAGQVMEAEGGTLEVTLDSIDLSSPMDTLTGKIPVGPYVRLRVHDTGPGITSENLDRVFEPFFTTKGVGEGTGLGLAVVHGIVRERSGGISLESEPGHGTTFTVYLPATTGEAVERETEKRSAPPRGSERILFIDDEPMIIRLGKRMLENLGYKVETLERSTEALETFRRDPSRFDLVITDMTMPGMRGDKLAEEIMAIRPDIPMILCTGYSRQITEERAREIGIRAFVMKPLTANELGNVVRRVLDGK